MNEELLESPRDWKDSSLRGIIEHIVTTHHSFCRQEVAAIIMLLKRALDAHRSSHPELTRIQILFLKMSKDLSMHLLKEEETLFPYIERVENLVTNGAAISWPPFGTVENPIRMMVLEHDQTENELREIRKLSCDFTPPADASEHLVSLYKALASFDQDMQRHIDIENHELFPRAVAMEEQACARKRDS